MPEIQLRQRGDLQGIPSLFGRLSFIAASRDPATGLYRLPDRPAASAEDEMHVALTRLHRGLFVEWLSLSVERRARDITIYLKDSARDLSREVWSDPDSHRSLLPHLATLAEESLFTSDLRLLTFVLTSSAPQPLSDDRQIVLGKHDWRISAAIDYAQQKHNVSHPTLKILSHDLRVSARHLGRIFRKRTGIAFHRYLKAARLAKAADLLRTLSLSIKEISATVGYTSISNFSRDFTSITGLSPTRYREHLMTVIAHKGTDAMEH